MKNLLTSPICGLWIDKIGHARVSLKNPDNTRREEVLDFKPFIWSSSEYQADGVECSSLQGPEGLLLNKLLSFKNASYYADFLKRRPKDLLMEKIANLENQYLMLNEARYFEGMKFSELRRMQLDIETSSQSGFPNPDRDADRIIAVGIGFGGETKILEISANTDDAESELLMRLNDEIQSSDPDTIEGHNIFRFDLDYIRRRSKKLKVPMLWGRFAMEPSFRNSRISIAERIFEYPRMDIPGRTVVDTLLLLQIYDISLRELDSYSLKNAAIHFGISKKDARTYIDGSKIQNAFWDDRETFNKYLEDDIRETKGLADRLLPSYVAQVQNFPLTFQECLLRGTGLKVEYIFLEKYLHANAKLPQIPAATNFVSGGFSESFKSGTFKNILHYDVASLYPSLMLHIGKCPKNDYLNVFLDVLKDLRGARLEYKRKAKSAADPLVQKELDARQNSFKILINSFYGYLGLSSARFGDSALADEITTSGRTLLHSLMDDLKKAKCEILEADTDGVYISSKEFFEKPETLIEKVNMPKGVDLEFDGAYKSMFCYKAKNYALLNCDNKVTIKGSGLRSRAMEKFLRILTNEFLKIQLGASEKNISELIENTRKEILSGKMNIDLIVKNEHLSMSCERYKKAIEETGKGRRASIEAALKLKKEPGVGDKIHYFISDSEFSKGADWKRSFPIEMYHEIKCPYDKYYYEKKLNEWIERFAEFIPSIPPAQGELF